MLPGLCHAVERVYHAVKGTVVLRGIYHAGGVLSYGRELPYTCSEGALLRYGSSVIFCHVVRICYAVRVLLYFVCRTWDCRQWL